MKSTAGERSPTPRGGSVDKKEKFGWHTLDEPGVAWEEDKRNLHIDSTYQRTMISESRVLGIASAWSWVACGAIIVSERDRKFWVIDGQHRVAAAMRRSDIQKLPCIVFKYRSVEEEARAFVRANCVRGNVTPFDKLRANLASSEQLAIDLVELMEQQGYKPSATEGRNTVRCITAFSNAMKSSRGVLQKVWPLVAKLHDGLPIKVKIFNALLYIAKFGTDDITNHDWTARVLKHGLHKISDSVDRASSLYAKGGVRVQAIGALEVINHGVHQRHRIHLDESNRDGTDSEPE